MNESAYAIQALKIHRDVAAQEHMNAIVSAQRLGVLELADRTEELGCSFEEATRALFQNIVQHIFETCRSGAERDDESVIMKTTMQRLIAKYEDD